MKRIKWKQLRNQIPSRVEIGSRWFEIIWIDEFKDGKTLGETRFDPPQIVLKTNETDKETVKTYLHEITHAVSDEEEVGLTENQVIGIERSLTYLLKPNNVFTEKK